VQLQRAGLPLGTYGVVQSAMAIGQIALLARQHRVERLAGGLVTLLRLTAIVHAGNGFDRHRIHDGILDNITDGGEEDAQDIPHLRGHHRDHRLAIPDQRRHDDQTDGEQSRAQTDKPALPPPGRSW
jgi:hypothetical protein